MSGRGHPAALPEAGHARPEYLVADGQGGLIVCHYNREGRVREYDFAALPIAGPMQASLAALFAGRCTPDRWSAHVTSEASWLQLRRFAEFLARQQRPPRDLDELTPVLLRHWRQSLTGSGGYTAFGVVRNILRDDSRLQEGPVADELARRYAKPRSRVRSYSEAELGQFVTAARRRFRAALQRISDNALHLQRWRDGAFGEGSRDWVVGEGLDILARTGDLPKYADKNGKLIVKVRYRNAFGGGKASVTWQLLFLTRLEAAALGVLLMAEFGWNLSVIDNLEVACPALPGHPRPPLRAARPAGPGRGRRGDRGRRRGRR